MNGPLRRPPEPIAERVVEYVLFTSRWLLAPIYLGLVAGLAVLLVTFVQHTIKLITDVLTTNDDATIVGVLGLIDLALGKAGFLGEVGGDPTKLSELAKIKQKASEDYGSGVVDYLHKEHTLPMRSVLGSLPFDELAELAHTLVLLESLKERVTSNSASVSGPIDVAVISKNDGFIWIKRKHYFDPQLNPRYFVNRGLPRGIS
jgi:hypothetical protein